MNNILNEQILQSIDDIDDCVMEAELAVINSMYDYCQKAITLYENYNGDECDCFDVFMETSTDGTKKSFGSKAKAVVVKIWKAIKAFFRFIIKQLSKIIDLIKNLFKRKKKTVDQIITDCGVKPNESVHSGEKDNIKVSFSVDRNKDVRSEPTITTQSETLQDISSTTDVTSQEDSSDTQSTTSNTFTTSNNQSVELTMSSPQNTVVRNIEKVDVDVPVRAKDIMVKMMENGDLDIIVFNDVFKTGANEKPVKGQKYVSNWYTLMAFVILSKDDVIEKFSSIVEDIINVFVSRNNDPKEINSVIQKFDEFHNMYDRLIDSTGSKNISGGVTYNDSAWNTILNINQFTRVQKILNEILTNMDKFAINDSDSNITMDSRFVQRLQWCLNMAKNMQVGVNSISAALNGTYTIDKRFMHTINDPSVLDKFVHDMIKTGVPSKYVAYNAWLVCDKNIVDVSKYTPMWGQSRIIFFPSDKPESVYKIALSSMGVSANKSEIFIYKIIPNGIKVIFAKPNNIWPKGAVQEMVKCDTRNKVSQAQAKVWAEEINKHLSEAKLPFRISDLHSGNFGEINGIPVCFDYGAIVRF